MGSGPGGGCSRTLGRKVTLNSARRKRTDAASAVQPGVGAAVSEPPPVEIPRYGLHRCGFYRSMARTVDRHAAWDRACAYLAPAGHSTARHEEIFMPDGLTLCDGVATAEPRLNRQESD
jgi:hypothetical protein